MQKFFIWGQCPRAPYRYVPVQRTTALASHTIIAFSFQVRAIRFCSAGRKWPAGCKFETPDLDILHHLHHVHHDRVAKK